MWLTAALTLFNLFIACLSENIDGVCDKDGGCEDKNNRNDRINSIVIPGETIAYDKSKCRMFRRSDFGPDSPSFVFGEARGRLGNQLLSYALLSHFSRKLKMRAFVNSELRHYLNKVFTEDSIQHVEIMEETFCNPNDIPWESYSGHIKDFLNKEEYRKGRFILFFPPKTEKDGTPKGYRPEEHLSTEQEQMNREYVAFLRKTLRYKPKIETKVRKTFKKVAKAMGKKKIKDVTFVGIHNRRTDSVEFIRRDWFQEPLRDDYFHDAMEYFREEYDNCAFLYVSDDMPWGRKNLKSDKGDLFFVSDGDSDSDESVGFDLAVLTSSNHTIISRGTFSMWGAMLSGGEYYTEYGAIVPTELQ